MPALSSNLHGVSHEVLKTACIRYASTSAIPAKFQQYKTEGYGTKHNFEAVKKEIHVTMPFVNYAISHVFNHSEQAQKHRISQSECLGDRIAEKEEWHGYEKSWWNVFERFKTRKHTSTTTLLYFLVEQDLTSLVKQLLRTSNCINAICGKYGSALQVSCAVGNEEIVRSLIAKGADFNMICGEHKHALLTAIYTKNFSLIPILRERGAHLQQAHLKQVLLNSFFVMIARGIVPGVRHLLQLGADIHLVSSRGQSPLELAIQRLRFDVVDLLVQHTNNLGTKLDLTGSRSKKLLRLTAGRGIEQVVRLLLKQGVDVNVDNGSALIEASARGQLKILRLLVENGADVNANNGCALVQASVQGHIEVVRLLIEIGADVNAGIGANTDSTALQAACSNGNDTMTLLLLKNGASINGSRGWHGSALRAACVSGHEKTILLLLKAGADVNMQSGSRGSALQAASERCLTEIVEPLLNNSADINQQGGEHGTALGAAALVKWASSVNIVRLLIDKGADLDLRGGKTDETPIQIAYRGRAAWPENSQEYRIYSKKIQILIDAGAEDPGPPLPDRFPHLSLLLN